MFVRIELTSGFNKEILLSVCGFPGKVRIEIDRKSALVEPTFVDSEKVFSQKFSLFPADDIKEAMPFEEEFNSSLTANLSPYIRSCRKIGQFELDHSNPVPEKVDTFVKIVLGKSSKLLFCLSIVQKNFRKSYHNYVIIIMTDIFD